MKLPKQEWPSPSYPGEHAQEKEPIVFIQNPLSLQLCPPEVHSFTSNEIKKRKTMNKRWYLCN